MSQPTTKTYPAEFKERAVKLAVESDQSIAQTARDLGVNDNTLHTWIGKDHRAERQEQQVQDEHLDEERKRLRKENAPLKEEREICNKAAASFAPQRPYSTPGWPSSLVRSASGACVSAWESRAVAPTSGAAAHPGPWQMPLRRCKTQYHVILRKGVAPRAHAVSSICGRR